MREDRVDADAVDADAVGDRIVVPGPKLGQLRPSTTCEVEDVEEKDHSAVFLQRDGECQLLPAGGRQLEVRCLVPDLQHYEKVYWVPDSSTYQPDFVAPLMR